MKIVIDDDKTIEIDAAEYTAWKEFNERLYQERIAHAIDLLRDEGFVVVDTRKVA